MARMTYKKINVLNMILLAALFIVTITGLLISYREIQNNHTAQLQNKITEIKKKNLLITVKNTISTIECLRNEYSNEAMLLFDIFIDEVTKIHQKDSKAFIQEIKNLQKKEIFSSLILVHTSNDREEDSIPSFSHISTLSHIKHEISLGGTTIKININEQWVYNKVLDVVRINIYQQTFNKNEYIWINEVVDWSGGDNYAIRLVHPNLKETEGQWLSTNTVDVSGKKPYQEELEGVKKDGSLFFYYNFKELNSNTVSKKLTYAERYETYDWIIAMGAYTNDFDIVMENLKNESRQLIFRIITHLLPVLLLLFIFVGLLYYININHFLDKFKSAIRLEANHDPLTGVLNRRLGNLYLKGLFHDVKKGNESPAVLMLDIDNFKKINDKWGHDIGDKVIQALTQALKTSMRTTDYLFRWGGEEFLFIYTNIKDDELLLLGTRLNNIISSTKVQFTHAGEEKSIHFTVSIGISKMYASDSSPQDSIKRADNALYLAKNSGKNCSKICLT